MNEQKRAIAKSQRQTLRAVDANLSLQIDNHPDHPPQAAAEARAHVDDVHGQGHQCPKWNFRVTR